MQKRYFCLLLLSLPLRGCGLKCAPSKNDYSPLGTRTENPQNGALRQPRERMRSFLVSRFSIPDSRFSILGDICYHLISIDCKFHQVPGTCCFLHASAGAAPKLSIEGRVYPRHCISRPSQPWTTYKEPFQSAQP